MENITEGLSKEEKIGLIKDLKVMQSLIQTHDQSLFQLIAAIATTQELMIDKGLVTKEEVEEKTLAKLEDIQNKFLDKLKQEQAKSEQEEEKKES